MNWVIVIRTLNVLGSLVALAFLLNAAFKQWKNWNFKTQMHWWALAGWVALCLEGTAESAFLNIEAGPRTILTTLVLAWTTRALLIDDDLKSESSLRRKDKYESQ